MTNAERALWRRLRRRQILGVRFYRQEPLGDVIVDFFAPRVGLVVEVDGGQHRLPEGEARDRRREEALRSLGLTVVRYTNREVMMEIEAVAADVRALVAREIGEIGN